MLLANPKVGIALFAISLTILLAAIGTTLPANSPWYLQCKTRKDRVVAKFFLFFQRQGERSLFPGLDLIIVKNYKTVIISHDSLKPAHPFAVAQEKLQPKEQM